MNLHKFKDFDAFYDRLLPEEKNICAQLRRLVVDNFPQLREKFGYGVPYYHRHTRVCFFYPASFPYSGQPNGVALGFARGCELSDPGGLLELGDRKQVAYVRLLRARDIPEEAVLELLHEAVWLDELAHKHKTARLKK
ncbi:MAG: DUF1801 domain-containing protein [Saprospiraceae bacterium]|nr:DUF1801 domain-containing protein [Saprospiraceae bacterium]